MASLQRLAYPAFCLFCGLECRGRGRPGVRGGRCRPGCPGDREFRGEGIRDHALPRSVQALDQAGAQRGDRIRRGDRRQAHPDQCARGSLRQPGADSGECGRRQAAGHAWWPSRRASTSPCCSSTMRRSSTRIPRWRAPASCRRSRMRCWPMDSRPAATRCPSPRASCRASSSSPYNYPVSGLRIQVDAAINPGNSGGPAIAGDKMIGLAFSKLGGDAQNIGYIIPNEEVDLFLKDIADGHYDGKPAMYDELQTLENPALREYPEARQVGRWHGRPPAGQDRCRLSAEGVGRPDPHRRYPDRQSRDDQARQGPAGELRVPDSTRGQGRQGAHDHRQSRQDRCRSSCRCRRCIRRW